MKLLAIVFLAASLLVGSALKARAGEDYQSYTVQKGDSLWKIAEARLGSPWCWPLIASHIENKIDYQGQIYAGKKISLPLKEECDAIMHPLVVEASQVSETVLAYMPSQPWHAQMLLLDDYIESVYQNEALLQGASPYDNMFNIYDPNLRRERDGNTWYVVRDGQRGRAWDYVDHVMKNDVSGSVFYRARDLHGDWYLIKNEEAIKLTFEPTALFLIPSIDEAFLFRVDESATRLYSSRGEWTMPVKAYPVAIDPAGRVLFREATRVNVRTADKDGNIFEVCSSSVCSRRETYWLDGKMVASTSRRMIPLFSSRKASVKLPFFYEGAQKTFKYYGVYGRPSFDSAGRLVFHVVNDSKLSKKTFDLRQTR